MHSLNLWSVAGWSLGWLESGWLECGWLECGWLESGLWFSLCFLSTSSPAAAENGVEKDDDEEDVKTGKIGGEGGLKGGEGEKG